MKYALLFIVSIITLSIGCTSDQKSDMKLYKCGCEEIPDLGDSIQVVQKIKYTYLVKSNKIPTCCDEPVETNYPGYKEIWKNEAPNHPTVWQRSTSNLIEIKAVEAQRLGCAMENKTITVADLEKHPSSAKDLYPKLTKQN